MRLDKIIKRKIREAFHVLIKLNLEELVGSVIHVRKML